MGRLYPFHYEKQVKEHVLSNVKRKKKKKKKVSADCECLAAPPTQSSGQHRVPKGELSGAGDARMKQSGKTLKTILSQFMSVTEAERRFADSPAQQIAIPLPIPLISSGVR